MNLRIKYVRLSAIVALLFLILMFSEVRVRLEAAAAAFTDLKAKEKSLMTPNEIRSKKKTLLIERERLFALRKQRLPDKKQNESGLFAHLTANASARKIVLEYFSPSEIKHENGMIQVSFTLNFTTDFHKAAAYVNSIETDSSPVMITGLNVVSDPPGNPALRVSLSGRAKFPSSGSASDRK